MFDSCSRLARPADYEQEMPGVSRRRSAAFIPMNPDSGSQMGCPKVHFTVRQGGVMG